MYSNEVAPNREQICTQKINRPLKRHDLYRIFNNIASHYSLEVTAQ